MSSSKSNWITKKFKEFDFLGEGISFTIENQPHLKTVCGGILRLLLYLIGIFLAFYFGKDFIGRKNPQVYYEVKESLEPMLLLTLQMTSFSQFVLKTFPGNTLTSPTIST